MWVIKLKVKCERQGNTRGDEGEKRGRKGEGEKEREGESIILK